MTVFRPAQLFWTFFFDDFLAPSQNSFLAPWEPKMTPKWSPFGLHFWTFSENLETLILETPHRLQAGRGPQNGALLGSIFETFSTMHFGTPLETIFEDFGLPLGLQKEAKRGPKNDMEPLFLPLWNHGRPQDPTRGPQSSILSDFGDFGPHFSWISGHILHGFGTCWGVPFGRLTWFQSLKKKLASAPPRV